MIDPDEDPPMVIVCQGPPACMLEGEEAFNAQEAGCIWCRRIWVFSDGHEEVTEPART